MLLLLSVVHVVDCFSQEGKKRNIEKEELGIVVGFKMTNVIFTFSFRMYIFFYPSPFRIFSSSRNVLEVHYILRRKNTKNKTKRQVQMKTQHITQTTNIQQILVLNIDNISHSVHRS